MRKYVTVNAQVLWISSYRRRRGWICRARISKGMAIRFSCQRLEYGYHGWRRAADAGSPRSFHGQRTVYSRDGEPDRAPWRGAIEHGAAEFLLKPFTLGALRSACQLCLELKEFEGANVTPLRAPLKDRLRRRLYPV